MLNVLIDFDNTFYSPSLDVDDGLALLYLLGSPEVNLVGITSTYGNSTLEEVHENTLKLMDELNLDRELYAKGCTPDANYQSDACEFIVQKSKEYSGDLIILATGSLTNLYGAYLRDPTLFDRIKQIVLMGGITEPLVFAKREMAELNFSCDPKAALAVLTKGKNISIMTGNNCLDLIFTREDYQEAFAETDSTVVDLIKTYSEPWFQDNDLDYGIKGYYCWDTLAAVYLVNSEYYDIHAEEYHLSLEDLKDGFLRGVKEETSSSQKLTLNTPKINSETKNELKRHIFNRWRNN